MVSYTLNFTLYFWVKLNHIYRAAPAKQGLFIMFHSEMMPSLFFLQKKNYLFSWIGERIYNHIYQVCWKKNRSTIQGKVVLKSRGQGSDESRGQISTKIFYLFPDKPDINGYARKLLEQHFNVWVFCNPGEKILILVET